MVASVWMLALLAAAGGLPAAAAPAQPASTPPYREPYRPQYRFTPQRTRAAARK